MNFGSFWIRAECSFLQFVLKDEKLLNLISSLSFSLRYNNGQKSESRIRRNDRNMSGIKHRQVTRTVLA